MSRKSRTLVAIFVCAAAGLIVGMLAMRPDATAAEATDGYRPAESATAAIIGERATMYWQARTRQDLYGSYPFYEASFRSSYEPEAFVRAFQRLNRFGPVFDGIDRIEVDAGGARAKVFVKLRSTSPFDGAPLVTTTEDMWLLADGTWWRKAEAMTPTV